MKTERSSRRPHREEEEADDYDYRPLYPYHPYLCLAIWVFAIFWVLLLALSLVWYPGYSYPPTTQINIFDTTSTGA